MARSRFVRPETDKLMISNGDWLLVKRRLTHGEQQQAFARMYLAGVDGSIRANPLQVSLHKVCAFLVDWSLTDDAGPVVIRNQPLDVLISALNNLDPDDFAEINAAIDAHEATQAEARAQEKKVPAGESSAPAISASPSGAAGGSDGLTNSTPTTSPS